MLQDKTVPVVLALFIITCTVYALEPRDIVMVVLSQPNKYSSNLALRLSQNITGQVTYLQKDPPVIHLTHKDFNFPAAWTVLPLIPRLTTWHRRNASWLFICEDRTFVNIQRLTETLEKYDSTQHIWIGHALYDRDATIIHHFAFFEDPTHFKYPHLGAGVAISISLLVSLSRRLSINSPLTDFSIDVSHELAMFVHDKGKGKILKHSANFCSAERTHCATFPTSFQPCGDSVPLESIYFAVKTCKKFHKERLPIVQKTWAKHTAHIKYFSEFQDLSIPTVGLNIENTDFGHCGKTIAIFKQIYEDLFHNNDEGMRKIKWVVLADDDTILSVGRLQQLLSCYESSGPTVIGERYGYNLNSEQGYNYITGGGGMVFSVELLRPLVQKCKCPSPRSPDDMLLGLCMTRLGISITHSPYFHQARPLDYAPEYLEKAQVSFHKHWNIDPVAVYEQWFSKADRQMSSKEHNHHDL